MMDFTKIMALVSLAAQLGPDLAKFMGDVQTVSVKYLQPDLTLLATDMEKVKGDIDEVLSKYLLPDVAKVRADLLTVFGVTK